MDEHVILEETLLPGGILRWAPLNVEAPRELTPPEKIALDRKDRALGEKAESRSVGCWSFGCSAAAYVWVREVSFDFKGPRAAPVRHAAISSADYPGPVPGFCFAHIATGPQELAEAVYHDRPEIRMGAAPTRWFVSFTDDTRQGGDIAEINHGGTT